MAAEGHEISEEKHVRPVGYSGNLVPNPPATDPAPYGSRPGDLPTYHDQGTKQTMDRGSDCVEHVDRGGKNTTSAAGVGSKRSFGISASGTPFGVPLHASTKYTAENKSGKQTFMAWKPIVNPSRPWQQVFVRHGVVDPNDLGSYKCPSTKPDQAWTDSSPCDKTFSGSPCASVPSGEVVRPPDGPSRWGEHTASADYDCNADGVMDVYVGQPFYNNGIGRVYLMSGKSLADGTNVVLARFDSPVPQAGAAFGSSVSVLSKDPGTINATQPRIAIGTDSQDVGGHVDQGEAWVFPGCGGSALFAMNNPYPQGSASNSARFGYPLGNAGDINGDGAPDVLVGASGNDVPAASASPAGPPGCGDAGTVPPGCRKDQGQSFVFDGATGALLRQLDFPVEDHQPPNTCESACGSFGIAVQGPGDTNGDGIVDHLVDSTNYNADTGRMYLFNGGSTNGPCQTQPSVPVTCESVRLKVDDPLPVAGSFFGFQDAAPRAPGDVNGDGVADLYGGATLQNATLPAEGKAWVFSGVDGHVLYQIDDATPTAGGQFGWSVARTTYKDPASATVTPALYIGAGLPFPQSFPGTDQNGGTTLRKFSDGTLLKELPLPTACRQANGTTTNLGPNLGRTVSAPGDLNGDGSPDYVAGSPFMDVRVGTVNTANVGLVFVFESIGNGPPCPPGGTSDQAP